MGYVDPKNKVKEGTENSEEIDDLLNDLSIGLDDNVVSKLEEEKKPDRYEPKL